MNVTGACHCGNIAFDLAWPGDDAEIPARACDCTFCAKHGGVWTSHPHARLAVAVRDAKRVSVYEFGTKTAQFHVCATCGVVPVVTCRLDGSLYAVVNVNAFTNVSVDSLRRSPAHFGDENVGSRLDRRRRNWIRDVEFPAANL